MDGYITAKTRDVGRQLFPLKTRLSFRGALELIFYFMLGFSFNMMTEDVTTSGSVLNVEQSKPDRHTVNEWRNTFRKICIFKMKQLMKATLIGRPGRLGEVDECHVATRKYGKGRLYKVQHQWVLGMVCREDEVRCVLPVHNRSARTLNRMLAKIFIQNLQFILMVGKDTIGLEPTSTSTMWSVISATLLTLRSGKCTLNTIEAMWRTRKIMRSKKSKLFGLYDQQLLVCLQLFQKL